MAGAPPAAGAGTASSSRQLAIKAKAARARTTRAGFIIGFRLQQPDSRAYSALFWAVTLSIRDDLTTRDRIPNSNAEALQSRALEAEALAKWRRCERSSR